MKQFDFICLMPRSARRPVAADGAIFRERPTGRLVRAGRETYKSFVVARHPSELFFIIDAFKLLHDRRKRTVCVAVIERVVSEFCSNVRIRAVLDEETNDVCVTALYCVVKWSRALVGSKREVNVERLNRVRYRKRNTLLMHVHFVVQACLWWFMLGRSMASTSMIECAATMIPIS